MKNEQNKKYDLNSALVAMGDMLLEEDKEEFPIEPVVDLHTFITSPKYLGLEEPSPIQYEVIEKATAIYKDESEYVEVVLQAGKGSIAGNTRIWLPELGFIRVKDIAYKDKVYIVDTPSGPEKLDFVHKEGEGRILRLKTKFGYSIDVYEKHLMLAASGENKREKAKKRLGWREADSLVVGDYLPIHLQYSEPINPIDIKPDLAWWIGAMLGDGSLPSLSSGAGVIKFTNKNEKILSFYENIVHNYGPHLTIRREASGTGCPRLAVVNKTKQKVGGNPFVALLKKYNLVWTNGKPKPWNDELLNLSEESLCALLHGLWCTDGYLRIQKKENRQSICAGIDMCSEDILKGVQMALLRLGIISSVKKIREQRGKQKAQYSLKIAQSYFVKKLIEKIGFIFGKEEKCKEIINFPTNKIENHIHKGFYFDRIVSIEDVGIDVYYDLNVEPNHAYVAEGFVHENSGKDWMSRIILLRSVYKLLNLPSPQLYYGIEKYADIYFINVAPSGESADTIFFSGLKTIVENSPYFKQFKENDTLKILTKHIEFPKNLHCLSTNSSFASFEGLDVFTAILDEIDEFRSEDEFRGSQELRVKKSAEGIYSRARAGTQSRFAGYGKVVLLSWPRYKGSFIQQRWAAGQKERGTFVPVRSDGKPLCAWDVNPKKTREMYNLEYEQDPIKADAYFACNPPFAVDMFFRDSAKLLKSFDAKYDADGTIIQIPSDRKNHFDDMLDGNYEIDGSGMIAIHIDLGFTRCKAAVGIAHKVHEERTATDDGREIAVSSIIKLDGVKYYYPDPATDNEIDFSRIRDDIFKIKEKGYKIYKLTLDHFQSVDFTQITKKSGIRSEFLSVDRNTKAYDTLQGLVYAGNVIGFYDDVFVYEFLRLQKVYGRKIEAQGNSPKDGADAVCGAVFNAVEMPFETVYIAGDVGNTLRELNKATEKVDHPSLAIGVKALCKNCLNLFEFRSEEEKRLIVSQFTKGAICLICQDEVT